MELLVASLARPQGNITGLSTLEPAVSGKEVEPLKEIIPTLARVAVFHSSTSPKDTKMLDEIKRAATGMKVQIENLDISSAKAIEPAFQAATKTHTEAALWTVSGSITRTYHTEVVKLAIKNRLPIIYESRQWAENGGLISYGRSLSDLNRRAATYVDKISKALNPATWRWSNRQSLSW